ncbi:hypothetical protein BH11ACT2_BH11ACT2_05390 [soil metagenome]
MSATYPTPKFRRTALVPGIFGVIVCLAGLAAIDGGLFTLIRYLVAILALVVAVFAWQAKKWWWLIGLVPVAVLWNPVWPITLTHDQWLGAHYVAAMIFLACAAFIRVRNPEDRNRRN